VPTLRQHEPERLRAHDRGQVLRGIGSIERVHAHEQRFRRFRVPQHRRAYFARGALALRRHRVLEIEDQRIRGRVERFRDLAFVVAGNE
jgi:hypothetical protein